VREMLKAGSEGYSTFVKKNSERLSTRAKYSSPCQFRGLNIIITVLIITILGVLEHRQ